MSKPLNTFKASLPLGLGMALQRISRLEHQDLNNLNKIQELEDKLKESKDDYISLLAHHNITESIIADAQGLRPKTGKRLLYEFDLVKADLAKLQAVSLAMAKTLAYEGFNTADYELLPNRVRGVK